MSRKTSENHDIIKLCIIITSAIILGSLALTQAYAFCPPTCAPRADYTAPMMNGSTSNPAQQTQLTSGGTLYVGLASDPVNPSTSGQTNLEISFINKSTQTIQQHIDYKISVMEGKNQICGTSVLHTAEGSIVFPCQFPDSGTYQVIVEVDGILFQPIPPETATFSLVANGQNNTSTTLPQTITVSTDKPSYVSGDVITLSGHVTNPYPGQDVAWKLISPSGNVVVASQLALDNNGGFTTKINTANSFMVENGQYIVYVQQGDEQARTAQTQFLLTGIGTNVSVNNTQSNSNSSPVNLPPPAYMLANNTGTGINSGGGMTITTDKSSYKYGDTIMISGTTQNYLGDTPLTILIRSSVGNVVTSQQVQVMPGKTFSDSFTPTGNLWQTGTYSVYAQYGGPDISAKITFQFTGSTETTEPPSSSPITTPTNSPENSNATMNAPSQPSIATPVTAKIPAWVKNIFIWYGRGSISDDELIGAIQFLVQEGIIHLKQ